MKIIIDSGYMSYFLGYTPYVFEQFMQYDVYKNCVWIGEGSSNIRKMLNPKYKAHRKGKGDEQVKERVYAIRDKIKSYPYYYEVDYLEADDVIAAVHYLYPNETFYTIGVDKDLLQIPTINLWGIVLNNPIKRATIADVKMAKTINSYIQRPIELLFYQSLMGDRTDNIKRILPSRRYDIMQELMILDDPFSEAYSMYGTEYLETLEQVLLPHPISISGASYTTDELLQSLDWMYADKLQQWVTPFKFNDTIYDVCRGINENADKHGLYHQKESLPIPESSSWDEWELYIKSIDAGHSTQIDIIEQVVNLCAT